MTGKTRLKLKGKVVKEAYVWNGDENGGPSLNIEFTDGTHIAFEAKAVKVQTPTLIGNLWTAQGDNLTHASTRQFINRGRDDT